MLSQRDYLLRVLVHPLRTPSLFCVVLRDLECYPVSARELGDLGASPSDSSHISWGARCMDKLLPERSWRPGFTVGKRGSGEKVGRWGCGRWWEGRGSGGGWKEVPTSPFRLLGGSQAAPTRKMFRSWALGQQVGKYVVKSFPGRNWEIGAFAASLH